MASSKFVYVTYIRTTPTKLWKALIDPNIVEQYWFGLRLDCDWKTGSKWAFYDGDELLDSGQILEIIPKKRLVRSWTNQWVPKLKAEGRSRCTYEIEHLGASTKLTVTHAIARKNSKFIDVISQGWPMCLSNLKSLLETGKVALKEHPGHAEE